MTTVSEINWHETQVYAFPFTSGNKNASSIAHVPLYANFISTVATSTTHSHHHPYQNRTEDCPQRIVIKCPVLWLLNRKKKKTVCGDLYVQSFAICPVIQPVIKFSGCVQPKYLVIVIFIWAKGKRRWLWCPCVARNENIFPVEF